MQANCDPAWTAFYAALATKLLEFESHRDALLEQMKAAYRRAGLDLPHLYGSEIQELDPFTAFGLLNRRITTSHRVALLKQIAGAFSIALPVPEQFDGVALLNNLTPAFYGPAAKREACDLDHLWQLFGAALRLADTGTPEAEQAFVTAFDLVVHQCGVCWNITMALSWVRPFTFLSLDARTRWYMRRTAAFCSLSALLQKKRHLPTGADYLALCRRCRALLRGDGDSFPQLTCRAWHAWQEAHGTGTPAAELPPPAPAAAAPTAPEKTATAPALSGSYSEGDFLQEVFLEKGQLQTLKTLLQGKKNLILQGAPGVGKTYTARRLASLLLQERQEKRLLQVQFHQSYSYEDFVMGFRPTETGFTLREGVFYRFCKQAAADPGRPYVAVIDEINRGNLSRIFGELLVLLEADKRGSPIRLLYSDEPFCVPENLYVIGTMNTADRSLAPLEYALRRRFAFFTLRPAFYAPQFQAMVHALHSPALERLIRTVQALNAELTADPALGEGFCIGHSYFCQLQPPLEPQLQAMVEHEFLPLLQEYWFDEPDRLEKWSCLLREAVL